MKERILMIVAVLVLLSGCATHKPMEPIEMYTAPDFKAYLPEYITGIRLRINPLLDIADTALHPDFGFPESTTWPWYIVDMDDKNLKSAKSFLAVKVPLPDGQILPIALLPGRVSDFKGVVGGFMSDHLGRRLISDTGEMVYVPDWENVKPRNLQGIIKPISEMDTFEAKKGTQEYDDLLKLFEPFQRQEENNWALGSKIHNDYLKAYGLPTATFLTKAQSELLLRDESYKAKMKAVLLGNWYGFLSFPLMTPKQYGVGMVIVKGFQIPTKFWEHDIERPGYMDRKLTAVQGAAMMDFYDRNYGFKSMVSQQELSDMKEMLQIYRASRGE